MSDHFSVTVRRNGEEIVTIETNSLSGREISPADEETIRTAAINLLGFIGESTQRVEHVRCSRCGTCVSGHDPELGLVVRAWVECPECLEAEAKETTVPR